MTLADLNASPTRRYPSAGERAPEFELVGVGRQPVRSSALLSKGPVILTFYRGAWCPCCQADLHDLMRSMPELERAGVAVVGVFNDLERDAGADVVREYGLTFSLACDADGRTAGAFRLRRTAEEIAELEREFGALPRVVMDDEPWILPTQARFAILPDRVIARSDVVLDYHQRAGVEDLIPLLTKRAQEWPWPR
jgi:peroxiredoxin